MELYAILYILTMLSFPWLSKSVFVQTEYGWIRGKVTPEAINFLGIPYASPPRRWEYSRPPRRWIGVWDSTRVRPMCLQPACGVNAQPGLCLPMMSEDCLYLNIFVPHDASPGGNKSVMVFIHGGSFRTYSGGSDLYNGDRFVNKADVILVTFNYRLGVLGFLVTGSGRGAATGNYGIQDQRLALEWINRNINYFGGNPNEVTIFGQSSGATSVGIHLTSGIAHRFFQRAIMQSAPLAIPFKSFDQALRQGRSFSANLNCSLDLECMRQKSPMEIIDAQERIQINDGNFLHRFVPWMPHLDGNEVPLDLQSAFERGVFVRKPVIIGTTTEEGISFSYGAFRAPLNRAAFSALLLMFRPNDAFNLFSRYYPRNITDSRKEFAQLISDYMFICANRRAAHDLQRQTSTWLYVLGHNLSFINGTNFVPYCSSNACHGAELPYLFQSTHRGGFYFSSQDQQSADELLTYWSNFAKYGNPNGDIPVGLQDQPGIQWPRYTSNGPIRYATMVAIQPRSRIETDYHGVVCNAINQTSIFN